MRRSATMVLVTTLVFSSTSHAFAQGATAREIETQSGPPERQSAWRVRAATSFVAQAIQSPTTAVVFSRRRLVQTASFDWGRSVGNPRRPWRIGAVFALRIDSEQGETCLRDGAGCLRETDTTRPREYSPLAEPTRLDVPTAAISIEAPEGKFSAVVGRQLSIDLSGFARFDGVTLAASPWSWLSASAYSGQWVTDAAWLGSSGFAPAAGALAAASSDSTDARVRAPSDTGVVGGTLSLGKREYVRAQLATRFVWDESGTVASRLGVQLESQPWDFVSGTAVLLVDPTDLAVLQAAGGVTAHLRRARIRARYARDLPRFDLGSIWAYFDVAASQRGELSAEFDAEQVSLRAAAIVRQVDLPQVDADLGAEGSIRLRRGSMSYGAWTTVFAGGAGTTAIVALDAQKSWYFWNAYGRVNLWHFRHPWQEQVAGNSLGTLVGVSASLTEILRLRAECEWLVNERVGHRFRLFGALTLELDR